MTNLTHFLTRSSLGLKMRLLPFILLLSTLAISTCSAAAIETALLRIAPESIPSSWQESALSEHDPPFEWTINVESRDIPGLTARMKQIAEENKGNWLSDEELRQYAAPTQEATDAVLKFLASKEILPSQIKSSRYGDRITVNTTIGKTAEMFNAIFKDYKVGQDVIPRTKEYTIPAALAPHVKNISPLAVFAESQRSSQGVDITSSALRRRATTVSSGCDENDVTQKCLKEYYGTASYTPSKGSDAKLDVVLIGFGDDAFDQQELSAYLKAESPGSEGYQVPVTYRRNAREMGKADVEVMIALETLIPGIYPLTTGFISYGTATRHEDQFDIAFADLIDSYTTETRPKVVVVTWSGVENWFHRDQAKTMCETVQKLTSLGVTVMAVSGNGGVSNGNECPQSFHPLYPVSCPYIVTVGATQGFRPEVMAFKQEGSNKIYHSGSGFSNLYSTPDYQATQVAAYKAVIGTQRGHYNSSGRSYPDMAAYGSFNMRYQADGAPFHFGGTTASVSIAASIIALTNDKRSKAGMGPIGFAHPALYKTMLNDITDGGSYYCGNSTFGFAATPGWDAASGQGAPTLDLVSKAFGV